MKVQFTKCKFSEKPFFYIGKPKSRQARQRDFSLAFPDLSLSLIFRRLRLAKDIVAFQASFFLQYLHLGHCHAETLLLILKSKRYAKTDLTLTRPRNRGPDSLLLHSNFRLLRVHRLRMQRYL
jgi:hypothetical protein